jgi:hypothetical protein
MNRQQIKVLWIGALALVAALLFPPWHYFPYKSSHLAHPSGWAFVMSHRDDGEGINYSLLAAEWAAIVALTFVAYVTARWWKRPQ